MEALARHLTDWIAAEVAAAGGAGAVFGLSGGLDSAVLAVLAEQALPGRALGVIMPCHSDPRDAEDAALVAQRFGVRTTTVDLGPVHDLLLGELSCAAPGIAREGIAAANLKPRLRMTALYAFANQLDYRVLGSDNRSEIAVGYFTKYGDGGADLLPLGDLLKSEVRDLARHLGVPGQIIAKPPSAGLWAGQTDEAEMGLTYEELDAYLLTSEAPSAVKARVDALHAGSEHKRRPPRIAPGVEARQGLWE